VTKPRDDADAAAASADADDSAESMADEPRKRDFTLRTVLIVLTSETVFLVVIALVLYYVLLTFVARPYLIPSESMEPTLHGCTGCVGDRIMVDKLTYRFSEPEPGDVVVFKGPPSWNLNYKSIRSDNTAIRWMQNALSFVGFVPPDENDLVKRVIAVGGQTVQCRTTTGLTVDGKKLHEPYLDDKTLNIEPTDPDAVCLGNEFGPVKVPDGRLWVMGDNRTHSADSRFHCTNEATAVQDGVWCTGDAMTGTVPVKNVIGKARFIAWPPGRWGGVITINPQQ
jgi:signal peptidase I